jgi:hypothetical protein
LLNAELNVKEILLGDTIEQFKYGAEESAVAILAGVVNPNGTVRFTNPIVPSGLRP